MCMAIAKPKGAPIPSAHTLSNCEWSNRDGAGVAWTDGSGVVKIKKDFDNLAALQAWIVENMKPEYACLIHFRQATSGGVSIGMRHPFPLSNNETELMAGEIETDKAMIHNGVIWDIDTKKTHLSDTAIFVKDILSNSIIKNSIRDNNAVNTLIAGTLGSTNKIAVLHGDGLIQTWGEFETEDGVLYSNDQYKDSTYDEIVDLGKGKGWKGKPFNDFPMGKGYEYCVTCYIQYPKKKMIPYKSRDSYAGDMICRQCHAYKNKRGGRRDSGPDYEACEVCDQLYDPKVLSIISFPVLSREREDIVQEKTALVCPDCETSISRDAYSTF